MAIEIMMPKMGDEMTEGKLISWIKHEGDAVLKGEPIAEIETDKITVEIEVEASGILQRTLVREGDVVPVGQCIGLLTSEDEQNVFEPEKQPSAPAHQEREAGETPLVAVEIPFQADETVAEALPVILSSLERSDESSMATRPAPPAINYGRAKASPLARRLAQEHRLDISTLQGTGPGGRVLREDVLRAVKQASLVSTSAALPLAPPQNVPEQVRMTSLIASSPSSPQTVMSGARGTSTEQALTKIQQTTARRMVESKMTAPHFYLTIEVDMTEALILRGQLNKETEDGSKISVNDLVVKAAARALKHFPVLNASFAGDRLLLHDEISIAIAVALDTGLVTPVIRQADQKALGVLAREIHALAERARSGKSRLEDYQGGTFTISNLGMFHIDTFAAIINPPQAAILAVGTTKRIPVYIGDVLTPRERMQVTLSADHRVTDGATGARFLEYVRNVLEHPLRLVM
jgi:pyruvate dehydrogenase E2 component (dihydrolipoamide acetyltransferase)